MCVKTEKVPGTVTCSKSYLFLLINSAQVIRKPRTFSNQLYCSNVKIHFCFLFFGFALWLAGSQFPHQGLNLDHGSESAES